MEKEAFDRLKNEERTEEVQHIIERMPTKFGLWISSIVFLLFVLMFFFGVKIRYPDLVTGQIIINANEVPIKLISNSSGKIKLVNIKSLDAIKEDQVIAYIINSGNINDVLFVDSLMKFYNPTEDRILELLKRLPTNLTMGDLNSKYYTFLSSLKELDNYKQDHLFEKQIENLSRIHVEQEQAIQSAAMKVKGSESSLKYMQKFHHRDSILLNKKVLSQADFDKTEMNYLQSADNYETSVGALINGRQLLKQTEGKIQEYVIQKSEKDKELRLAVLSAYNDLKDNIEHWEQTYIFRAPFSGKIQFLKFWSTNQYIQTGEAVFTVVPKENSPIGQVILPIAGAGKVKIGQEVIVKLEDYPYVEYGSIKGTVQSISLTTNTMKLNNDEVESYLVTVKFLDGMKTNYGTKLDFKFESKGTAEIITHDRKLIERLFDNLKYTFSK